MRDGGGAGVPIRHRALTMYRRCAPPDGGRTVRLLVWGLGEERAESLKSYLRDTIPGYLHARRARQKNGARRWDLYVDEESFRQGGGHLTERLQAIGGHVVPEGAQRPSETSIWRTTETVRGTLSVMTLNIGGMGQKVPDLSVLLDKTKPVVLAMQETLLRAPTRKLFVPGYTTIEVKRGDNEGARGLSLSLRKGLGMTLTLYRAAGTHLAGAVEGRRTDGTRLRVLVVSVYLPGGGAARRRALDDVASLARNAVARRKFDDVVLAGDWNGTPRTVAAQLQRRGVTVSGVQEFRARTRRNGARGRGRCIDFSISLRNADGLAQRVLKRWDLSDHYPVVATLRGEFQNEVRKRLALVPARLRDTAVAARVLHSPLWAHEPATLDEHAAAVRACAESLHRTEGLVRETGTGDAPACSMRTRRAINRRRRYLARHGSADFDPAVYGSLARLAERSKAEDRRRCHVRHVARGIAAFLRRSTRLLWQWLRHGTAPRRLAGSSQPVVDRRDGRLVHTQAEIAAAWEHHFRELARDTDGSSRNTRLWAASDTRPSAPVFRECNDRLTWAEVRAALRRTPRGKAPGLDGIASDFYKLMQADTDMASPMARTVFRLLERAFETGTLPRTWNTSVIVPVPKRGDMTDCSNYRGISLINTLAKVLATVVAARVADIGERHGLLAREQAGFRRREESVAQAACLVETLQRRANAGLQTVVCFLDFEKAYDRVPHAGLLHKLRQRGFGGRLLRAVEALYAAPRAVVRVGDTHSREFAYEVGVRQGCPSSPVLFNLYINDLLEEVAGVSVPGQRETLPGLLFADDAVVLAATERSLEEDLRRVDAWCTRWRMRLNRSKCGVLRVGCAGSGVQSIAGIPVVSSYTYLGVVIDESLSQHTMVRGRRDAARNALQAMQALLLRRAVPVAVKLPLIRSALVPVATYGCELFGMNTARVAPLSAVVDRGMQMVLGCTRSFCRRVAYEELGIEPVPVRAAKARMRAVLKWSGLQTRMADMVAAVPRQRRCAWVTQTQRWVRRFARNTEQYATARDKIRAVGEAVAERARRRDRSVIARQREAAGIQGVFPGLSLAARHNDLAVGWHAMVLVRTGAFPYAPRLAASGRIDARFRAVCPFCEGSEAEDAEHLLLRCRRWDEARQWLFRKAHVNPPLDMRTVGVLLGGGRDAATSPLQATMVATATYLNAVVRRRAGMLRGMTN